MAQSPRARNLKGMPGKNTPTLILITNDMMTLTLVLVHTPKVSPEFQNIPKWVTHAQNLANWPSHWTFNSGCQGYIWSQKDGIIEGTALTKNWRAECQSFPRVTTLHNSICITVYISCAVQAAWSSLVALEFPN